MNQFKSIPGFIEELLCALEAEKTLLKDMTSQPCGVQGQVQLYKTRIFPE
jgi:hypothetical protein